MPLDVTIRHSYEHAHPFLAAYGMFGPYCAACYDLACAEDEAAGIIA